jgi:hypothetical protein
VQLVRHRSEDTLSRWAKFSELDSGFRRECTCAN